MFHNLGPLLEARRDRLNQYQGLAQTGNYPGNAEISDGLGVLAKLLTEHENFELITSSHGQKTNPY